MPTRVAWSASQLALFDPDQKKRKRNKPALERSTHIAVADMLWKLARPEVWFGHIPSGELRTQATGRLLFRMGTRPGMADFMLLCPRSGVLFLELKRWPNKLTKDQIIFRDAVLAAGAQFEVAYSYNEALDILTKWGVLKHAVHVSA